MLQLQKKSGKLLFPTRLNPILFWPTFPRARQRNGDGFTGKMVKIVPGEAQNFPAQGPGSSGGSSAQQEFVGAQENSALTFPPRPLIPDPNFPGYSEATKRKGRIWGFSPPPCSPPVFKGRTVPNLLCLQTDTMGTIFALNWKNPTCSFHFPPLAHKINS